MSDADNIDSILVSSGEKSADPRHAKEQLPDGLFSLLIGTVSEQAEERQRYRARVVRGDYNRGGRPPRAVPRAAVETMRKKGMSWCGIARFLGCSKTTLDNRRREWEEQDRNERVDLLFAKSIATARRKELESERQKLPEPEQPAPTMADGRPPRDVYDPNYKTKR